MRSIAVDSLAFVAYAVASVVLVLNLLILWVMSGGARARGKVAVNPEDGARFGASVADADPPDVARILRAHRNGEAAIYPFLVLAFLYVLAGGTAAVAIPIFAIFVLARLAHTFMYLTARQPGRTIAFAICLLAIVALVPAVLWSALNG